MHAATEGPQTVQTPHAVREGDFVHTRNFVDSCPVTGRALEDGVTPHPHVTSPQMNNAKSIEHLILMESAKSIDLKIQLICKCTTVWTLRFPYRLACFLGALEECCPFPGLIEQPMWNKVNTLRCLLKVLSHSLSLSLFLAFPPSILPSLPSSSASKPYEVWRRMNNPTSLC